jgi:hypothetical protein
MALALARYLGDHPGRPWLQVEHGGEARRLLSGHRLHKLPSAALSPHTCLSRRFTIDGRCGALISPVLPGVRDIAPGRQLRIEGRRSTTSTVGSGPTATSVSAQPRSTVANEMTACR